MLIWPITAQSASVSRCYQMNVCMLAYLFHSYPIGGMLARRRTGHSRSQASPRCRGRRSHPRRCGGGFEGYGYVGSLAAGCVCMYVCMWHATFLRGLWELRRCEHLGGWTCMYVCMHACMHVKESSQDLLYIYRKKWHVVTFECIHVYMIWG
jgi:hypothetical protein